MHSFIYKPLRFAGLARVTCFLPDCAKFLKKLDSKTLSP